MKILDNVYLTGNFNIDLYFPSNYNVYLMDGGN